MPFIERVDYSHKFFENEQIIMHHFMIAITKLSSQKHMYIKLK